MARSLDYYLSKITSEHNQQPDYIATLTVLLQPLVDSQAAVEHLPTDFDLDFAIGVQLDAVGVRVNRDRFVDLPLVYFALDEAGVGLDEGWLFFPGDPVTGITTLPDEPYRMLLRAVIAANQWDGTIPGAYAAWDVLFAGTPYTMLIQDYNDLSMGIILVGASPDAVTKALFTTGELDLKPAGVLLRHLLPAAYPAAVPGGFPLFGLDISSDLIAGLDEGYLVEELSTE